MMDLREEFEAGVRDGVLLVRPVLMLPGYCNCPRGLWNHLMWGSPLLPHRPDCPNRLRPVPGYPGAFYDPNGLMDMMFHWDDPVHHRPSPTVGWQGDGVC